MENVHTAQDVAASLWNAATVLLIPSPPPQRPEFSLSYPVVHPASSLSCSPEFSCFLTYLPRN